MELPKEDIILKQRKDNKKKRRAEYEKIYFKDPDVIKQRKKTQLLYRQINQRETPNRQPKPIYIEFQKEFYQKQRDSRKNPFLRSTNGNYILTFD